MALSSPCFHFPSALLVFVLKRVCFPFLLIESGSLETQKLHLSLHHPLRLVVYVRAVRGASFYTGIFRSRIPSIVAQTMVRQLISVVNTSIWSVRCRILLNRLSMALVVRIERCMVGGNW